MNNQLIWILEIFTSIKNHTFLHHAPQKQGLDYKSINIFLKFYILIFTKHPLLLRPQGGGSEGQKISKVIQKDLVEMKKML